MRVAVVSDVHGSLTALDAVVVDVARRSADLVVQGGDVALMGPQPAEVVDRLRELGWPGVVGNTDEVLWRPEVKDEQLERAPKLAPLLDLIFDSYAPWTLERIGDERVAWLRRQPSEFVADDLLVVHAAPGDLWRAPAPDADDAELERVDGGGDHAVAVYGHIHRPFVRRTGSLTVANSGSASLTFDGDPRASYLLIDDGEPRVVRVEYDVERDVDLLGEVGHPDAERLARCRREARFVAPG
jgi:putative phosphoesterase